MQVTVIGAGYVGLVQAAGLASLGHDIRLAEADPRRLAALRAGETPIFEEGLEGLLTAGLEAGSILLFSDNVAAANEAEVVFLCLPTPPGIDGAADITIVTKVIEQLANELGPGPVLAIKSTVPVGTAERLSRRFGARASLVSNPEFLREGTAVSDFLNPDRIVVGAKDPEQAKVVAGVYEGLRAPIVLTDPTSAELIKYGANSYLAARLTFVNALANVAETVGADIMDVVHGMGLDSRIGPHFLKPGPGYGGSCFPKDTIALLATSRQAGYEFSLLQTVVDSDRNQRHWIVGNVRRMLNGDVGGKRIAMWGIAFKAGTDDIRESPALKIAHVLIGEGAVVAAYDPEAIGPEVEQCPDPITSAEGADLLLVATEWPLFREVDMVEVARVMRGDLVYDLRNLLDPQTVRSAGLRYVALGRPNI